MNHDGKRHLCICLFLWSWYWEQYSNKAFILDIGNVVTHLTGYLSRGAVRLGHTPKKLTQSIPICGNEFRWHIGSTKSSFPNSLATGSAITRGGSSLGFRGLLDSNGSTHSQNQSHNTSYYHCIHIYHQIKRAHGRRYHGPSTRRTFYYIETAKSTVMPTWDVTCRSGSRVENNIQLNHIPSTIHCYELNQSFLDCG